MLLIFGDRRGQVCSVDFSIVAHNLLVERDAIFKSAALRMHRAEGAVTAGKNISGCFVLSPPGERLP